MSEPGDLNQAIVEEGGTEQDRTTPENGIVKSESLDEEEKLELQRRLAAQNQERRKSKSGAGKGKLTRSLAVCEESAARPGGESLQDQESIHLQLSSFPSLQEDDKSRKDDSEREKEQDKNKDKSSEKPKIRMLSKDCSQEYTDSTGIDLHEFLINTLKNNSRDRMILLKMEQEIIDFIGDNNNHYKKFPQMSSYQRMLVHRVAAYFGLDHNVDQTGKSVIINKTSSTRIPEQRFCEHLKDEKGEESQKRFILKRDNSSIDKEDNQNRMHPFRDDRRSKSMEEREEEYQRVRDRIFAHDSVCSQESLFVENSRLLEDSNICNETYKKRQLFRGNRDGSARTCGSRQSSSETELKWPEQQRAWSSTDSDSSGRRGPLLASKKVEARDATKTSYSAQVSSLQIQDYAAQNVSSAVVEKPWVGSQQPLRGAVVGPAQQQPRQQPSPQPPLAGPLVAQSVQGLQASSQSVQYPAVSFPPQHLLPMSPTQQFPMREDVATQFGQMNLSRQSSGETPEPPPGPVYPPSLMPQPSQQPSYVIASTGQQLPTGGFSGSGPSLSQQVLQAPPSPQGFVQQPPPAQMPIYYYPSGQYPTSATQQYRSIASVQYSAQRGQQVPQTAQQAGYQPVLSGQQGFQGLMGVQQPPQNQSVMSNQPGTPVQSVMVSYPTMSSYQVPMTQGSQGLPQQSYQQPIMLPNQTGQGSLPATGMPVYCNVTPPTPQNNLRLIGPHCPSSTVPMMSASCRTNCASMSSAGWQVKF
ncbi:PREDICTED: cAMP-regulated phosphoprotein 21 [Miniopterus natalensis]|uniref:cAMP-regulated phosphoprotein 21 n=1 Tax=Miniopterus natalensis TaxID=291302 RepID=UPI0007A72971|nr:PREDICTED: cAMP-regulated phosphoprotein 21 [Miniopterus natalensis]